MCKHNENLILSFFALLIAYVDIIPNFCLFYYLFFLKFWFLFAGVCFL